MFKKIPLIKKSNIFAADLFDLVAQLVEHLPFKERVLGSSPSQVTYSMRNPAFSGILFYFCLTAQVLKLVDRHD